VGLDPIHERVRSLARQRALVEAPREVAVDREEVYRRKHGLPELQAPEAAPDDGPPGEAPGDREPE